MKCRACAETSTCQSQLALSASPCARRCLQPRQLLRGVLQQLCSTCAPLCAWRLTAPLEPLQTEVPTMRQLLRRHLTSRTPRRRQQTLGSELVQQIPLLARPRLPPWGMPQSLPRLPNALGGCLHLEPLLGGPSQSLPPRPHSVPDLPLWFSKLLVPRTLPAPAGAERAPRIPWTTAAAATVMSSWPCPLSLLSPGRPPDGGRVANSLSGAPTNQRPPSPSTRVSLQMQHVQAVHNPNTIHASPQHP